MNDNLAQLNSELPQPETHNNSKIIKNKSSNPAPQGERTPAEAHNNSKIQKFNNSNNRIQPATPGPTPG